MSVSEPSVSSDVAAARRALLERLIGGGSAARAGTKAQVDGVQSIQTSGSKAPFFFLHGQWQMPAFFCFHMSRALGEDRPFYGVDPFDLENSPVPPAFAAIAARHADLIRRVQPTGPYMLGGWCNGALLAYEIACQLQAQGEQVEHLMLLDPVYLRYPRRLVRIRNLIGTAARLIRRDESAQLRFYLWARQQLRLLRHVHAYVTSRPYRASTRLFPFGREDYPGVYDWTAMRYVPAHAYRGTMSILWSAGQPFRSGWRDIEAREACDVHVLSGTHETCLNDDLPELVEQMRRSTP